MHILENYYSKIIQYDLINKFTYTRMEDIPKLKKIILNFGCKSDNIKVIAVSLFSLELIAARKGTLTKAKRSNILLKIRKGHPVGCVVVLRKNDMYDFLLKLITEAFPRLKDFKSLSLSKRLSTSSFSFTLKDLIVFEALERQFYLFTSLPPLNVTFITNSKKRDELVYLLRALKLPL